MSCKFESDESSKIIEKIIQGDFSSILNKLCYINENNIYINYIYFKHLATTNTYSIIQQYVTNYIDIILNTYDFFEVHVNLTKLSLIDFDKHKNFIKSVSLILKDKYPDKLGKCYVYNSPSFFSQIYNFISLFIEKETLTKFQFLL